MALRASAILVAYVLLTVSSVVVIYGLSAGLGHIDPVLPFFSDIGDQPVESTLFTQCFVVDAAFLVFLVQIRFVYAAEMLVRKDIRKAQPANRAGLYVGYTAASGLFVVACFQESHVYFVHYVALLLYLAGSVVYFGVQAALSKSLGSFATTRMILAAFMCGFFLSYCAGYVVAMKQLRKPWEERHHWKENDGGWTSHLVSAASEWILILLFQAYALTFYKEFQNVMLTKTRIIVVSE